MRTQTPNYQDGRLLFYGGVAPYRIVGHDEVVRKAMSSATGVCRQGGSKTTMAVRCVGRWERQFGVLKLGEACLIVGR